MQILYDGLSVEDDKVVYTSELDSETDIMNTVEPDIYQSEFEGNIYYFGYTFKPNASRKHRSTVIKWIKNLDGSGVDESTLRKFIDKPLKKFDSQINFSDISCIVYPRSNRSNLTNIIIQEIGNFSQRDTVKTSAEFVKALPKEVSFDWEMFDYEYDGEIGDNQYTQIRNYINNVLLSKIHDLDYFSIADSVKPRYRRYIQNYLICDKRSEQVIKSMQSGKILIVDDINTSGATLTEILRIVRKLNNTCDIYIFTLIGRG